MVKDGWKRIRNVAQRQFPPKRLQERRAEKARSLTEPRKGDSEQEARDRTELRHLLKPEERHPAPRPGGSLGYVGALNAQEDKERRIAELIDKLSHDKEKTREDDDHSR